MSCWRCKSRASRGVDTGGGMSDSIYRCQIKMPKPEISRMSHFDVVRPRASQLLKSLRAIGFEHYLQAEQTGWVLYLEGSTDLAILQAFADMLKSQVKVSEIQYVQMGQVWLEKSRAPADSAYRSVSLVLVVRAM